MSSMSIIDGMSRQRASTLTKNDEFSRLKMERRKGFRERMALCMSKYQDEDGCVGITQKRLREILFDCYGAQIGTSTIHRWLHLGENEKDEAFPRFDYLLMLADIFNVSVSYLIGEDDGTNPDESKASQYTGLDHDAIRNLHCRNVKAAEYNRDALSYFMAQEETVNNFAKNLAKYVNIVNMMHMASLLAPNDFVNDNLQMFDMMKRIYLESVRHKVADGLDEIIDIIERSIDKTYRETPDEDRREASRELREIYADAGLLDILDDMYALGEKASKIGSLGGREDGSAIESHR